MPQRCCSRRPRSTGSAGYRVALPRWLARHRREPSRRRVGGSRSELATGRGRHLGAPQRPVEAPLGQVPRREAGVPPERSVGAGTGCVTTEVFRLTARTPARRLTSRSSGLKDSRRLGPGMFSGGLTGEVAGDHVAHGVDRVIQRRPVCVFQLGEVSERRDDGDDGTKWTGFDRLERLPPAQRCTCRNQVGGPLGRAILTVGSLKLDPCLVVRRSLG